MRMTIIAAAVLLLAGMPSFAQFQGPGAPKVTTVAEAKRAPDNTEVVLTGRITAKVRSDNYKFKDSTGEIEVDIDDNLWRGRKVTPDTTIRISGEVDREAWGVEIDVDSFEIVAADASTKKGGFEKR